MSEEKLDIEDKSSKVESSSYRSIFKATSLFGGVQIYQIFVQLIRSKFVALLIGPLGIGIVGLYTTALDVIKQITSLGLAQSAIRDVSEANSTGNNEKIYKVTAVVRKLVLLTGSLGMLTVILLSPIISNTAFGNYNHIVPIIILSVTLLFDQLSAGQLVVLQGMRRLKDMAKSSAYGATLGLLLTVPIYYLWGIKGIVPTLILSSLIALCLTWYFSKKIPIQEIKISYKEAIKEGGTMIKMGIALCYSSVLVAINAYVIRSFIRYIDDAAMVGLYSAGVAITTTYVGMVFTAMSKDFYPRLVAVSHNNEESSKIINQQGEVASLILGPLILICVVFMPLVIQILYSDEFLPACNYIMYAIIGMMFRLPAWLTSIQFIAKGKARLFAINETIAGIYSLLFNLAGYRLGGLEGLGVSFIIYNFIYFLHIYLMAKAHFNFNFSKSFLKKYVVQLILILVSMVVAVLSSISIRYILGGILTILVIGISLRGLTKIMGLDLICSIKKRI